MQQHSCMTLALHHRFNVDEYYEMAEKGILKPDAKVELIEGEIVDMFPAGIGHNGPLGGLNAIFGGLAQGRWVTHSQGPLRIDKLSEPEPDLLLLRPPWKRYSKAHPVPEDVFLLVEVADSSLAYDQERKLPLYGRAGVVEYWIINVREKCVEVHREPCEEGYKTKQVITEGKIAPAAFPDAEIDVTELLH